MSERDLDALRAKALAATPGPWRHTCYMSGTQNVEYPGAKGVTFVDQVMAEDGSDICHESDAQELPFINIDHRAEDRGNDADPQRTRNAVFIAAANPATVLSLLDEIAAQYRAGFEAAREAAAKVCDHQSFNAETCAWAASADNCAAAIRAIPLPGGEK